MISSAQIRAARALLGLSQKEASEGAGVGMTTISGIEGDVTQPSAETARKLQSFFEGCGLEFISPDGVKRKEAEIIYRGREGFKAFMWDVYETMKREPGTYCVTNVNEENWLKWLGEEESQKIRDKTATLRGVQAQILVKEGDTKLIAEHAEYRAVPEDMFFEDTSVYVYASKLAIIEFEESDVTVRVIDNRRVAACFKVMFEGHWNRIAT